ncbi:hypothetical protein [Kiloniella majae]|uniref:hypothetical protein n=1 Tax=Kiloniella majae TaxID=1938558 RepID=UPI000A2781D2|nr:hypothetical protein [Kiloniella majae]
MVARYKILPLYFPIASRLKEAQAITNLKLCLIAELLSVYTFQTNHLVHTPVLVLPLHQIRTSLCQNQLFTDKDLTSLTLTGRRITLTCVKRANYFLPTRAG